MEEEVRSDSEDLEADGEMARLRSRGYAGFLELVAMLLCGDVNKATYDDACRLLVGTEAFRVRALDKMCRAAVEAMRSLAADDTLKPLISSEHATETVGDLDARKAALAKGAPNWWGRFVSSVRCWEATARRTSKRLDWPRPCAPGFARDADMAGDPCPITPVLVGFKDNSASEASGSAASCARHACVRTQATPRGAVATAARRQPTATVLNEGTTPLSP